MCVCHFKFYILSFQWREKPESEVVFNNVNGNLYPTRSSFFFVARRFILTYSEHESNTKSKNSNWIMCVRDV